MVFRGFPTFSRICIFFLLALSLLLFVLLIFLFSLPLPCSAFHLSILSEVWLLNFLRWNWISREISWLGWWINVEVALETIAVFSQSRHTLSIQVMWDWRRLHSFLYNASHALNPRLYVASADYLPFCWLKKAFAELLGFVLETSWDPICDLLLGTPLLGMIYSNSRMVDTNQGWFIFVDPQCRWSEHFLHNFRSHFGQLPQENLELHGSQK